MSAQGYYAAYKGKWHLTSSFEETNSLHSPKKIFVDDMKAYGFNDYFGIGDIIAHTDGGFLHDEVITATSLSWLRGQAQELSQKEQPWFLSR